MVRRILISWLLVTVAGVGFAGIAGASASDESSTASLINAERTSRGMNALEIYWDLTDDARAWTAVMIADGSISHNPNLAGVTSGWSSLGENVGVGPNVDRLHTAFMASAGHKANILGDFNYIGVGADRAPDGNLYITVVFMKGPAGLVSPPPTTPTTAPPPPATTTTTTTPPPTTTTTTTTTTVPPTSSTTTPPSASKSPVTTSTQPRTASASPTPIFADQTATVSAGHLSVDQRAVYPCTLGMILAPTPRKFCVV